MTQQDEVEIDGLRLVLTCSAYPEQYDVFKGDQQVAYLRLRGHFTAEMPDVGGDLVYEATPEGVGMFGDFERRRFLSEAVQAVNKRLGAVKRYVVVNENTLGLIRAGRPDWLEVLAGSVIKGGHDWKNGPTVISPLDSVRDANLADFEVFRVSPEGHIKNVR